MTRTIAVWYYGTDPSLYPMVMVEEPFQWHRYHYQVSESSLRRLAKIANRGRIDYVAHNGWTVRYD